MGLDNDFDVAVKELVDRQGQQKCPKCSKKKEEHRTFGFVSMPDEHIGPDPCPTEWIPHEGVCDDGIDPYPARVAYRFNDGEPIVQVHEGDDDGLWMPCSTETRDGITYWFCAVKGPKNPCWDDYMREISS